MRDNAVVLAALSASVVASYVLIGGIVHAFRDMAEDRAREQRYADEWVRTHKQHQRDRR